MRIVKTIGDKVISKLRPYNTFNYLGYEREVGDRPVVGELVFVRFLEKRRDNRFFENRMELTRGERQIDNVGNGRRKHIFSEARWG